MDPRLERIEDYIHTSQKDICVSEDRYIMIEGVAGSRKTDTLIRLALRRHIQHKRNILFLTQVGSVTDEIRARAEDYLGINIHRQAGSNHYLAASEGKTIEIANFDAWVHRQLEENAWPHLRTMGSYHSHKIQALAEMAGRVTGFCMKNGEQADEVYIDECQDFEIPRARLILTLLSHLPHVGAVFAGDYMQTLFERSLGADGEHPMRLFATLDPIRRFSLDRCYRCPRPHIDFCNLVMGEAFEAHGCTPLVAVSGDTVHRPFLFPHGGVNRQYDVHQLSIQCCDMLDVLCNHDGDIVPSDVCFLMRKCNDQAVFELLRVRLDAFWSARGFRNSVIHFATQYDGYRNSIQWNFAEDKTCLLSIHGDKGKSHKVVFLLGLTQKSIPDECCMHKDTELLYQSLLNVALTRSTRHLLVGFHHAQPSVYLSRIVDRIGDEACMGWKTQSPGLYGDLAATIRFPDPSFACRPRDQALKIPTLNIMTVTDISRRFERAEDLLGYRPRMETVSFGKRVRIHLPHELYPVLGHLAELVLLRCISPAAFRKDIEVWSDPSRIYFTDDERLLCWAHDFHLHQWIGTDMYATGLKMMEEAHRLAFQVDARLSEHLSHLRKNPSFVLPRCFDTPRFRENIRSMMSSEGEVDFTAWWNLSILFHEVKGSHRRPSLYRHIDMELNPRQAVGFGILLENIRVLASRFSKEIVFHPSHDLLACINDPVVLGELGFVDHPDLDERCFKGGYHYGIVGCSDILDRGSATLYEIKASHVDFSMEWLLQTSLYGAIPCRRKSDGSPKTMILANVVTGKLFKWERPKNHPKSLVKKIFELQSFPHFMIDHLCKSNHRRLKRGAATDASS